MSEQMLHSLEKPANYRYRFLGKVSVKGKQEPVAVFEIYDADLPHQQMLKLQTFSEFERAIHLYENQQLAEACQIFEQILQVGKAAAFYVNHTQSLQISRNTENWEEIEVLKEK